MDAQPLKWSEAQAQRIVRESCGAVSPRDMRVAEKLYDVGEIYSISHTCALTNPRQFPNG